MTDATPSGSDADAAPPKHLVAYVSGYGPNIAWFDVDRATGALSPKGTIAAPGGPSFLAIRGPGHGFPTKIYAANESTSSVGIFSIDPATGAITSGGSGPLSGGNGPAHIALDETSERVLVANYGDGAVAIFPVALDGGVSSQFGPSVIVGANAHQIITGPGNTTVFVPCKGTDRIVQYTFDAGAASLTPNGSVMTAAGAGPRHLAFHPDGQTAYLINENNSTLVTLSFDKTTGKLAAQGTVTTRAAGATGSNTGAEVAVHPNGKFLYASNRGDDNIAVFSIAPNSGQVTLVGHTPSGGMTPRMFAIDPSGAWLYAANQNSNSVITFAIDAQTGMLTRTGSPLTAQQPTFVGFVEL